MAVKRLADRLTPRSLRAQTTLLLVAAVLAAQALAAVLSVRERDDGFRAGAALSAAPRMAVLVRLIETSPPDLARAVAASVQTPDLRLRVLRDAPAPSDERAIASDLRDRLALTLARPSEDVRAYRVGPSDLRARRSGGVVLSVRLRPGAAGASSPDRAGRRAGRVLRDLDARAARRPPGDPPFQGRSGWLTAEFLVPAPPPVGRALLLGFLLSGIAVALVGALIARRVAGPIERLGEAAARFGRGEPVEPLRIEGPLEVAKAADAFDRMRERLERLMRDRTIMLASLSHDLRTPITTMRLRAEFVDDDETRDRLIETLDEMTLMTDETLAFARDDAVREPARAIDLAALVEALAEDVRAAGGAVDVVAPATRLIVSVRAGALKRVLRNLIDNAVAYGGRTSVSFAHAGEGRDDKGRDGKGRDGETVLILIDDDVPGIPSQDRERVFTPFVRLEGSRNRETGGTGLGLAIARALMRGRGGDVTLETAPSGGLRAVVRL